MTLESTNSIQPSTAQSVAAIAQASLAATLWCGRAIAPLAATALTIAALAVLVPAAGAYGDYYQGQQCEYDYYGNTRCYDVWCHQEEVCIQNLFGYLNCRLEEVCNYY